MDTKEKDLSKGNGGDSAERDMGPELNASPKGHQWSQPENDRIHFTLDTWINVSCFQKTCENINILALHPRNFPRNHGLLFLSF